MGLGHVIVVCDGARDLAGKMARANSKTIVGDEFEAFSKIEH